MGSGKCNSKSLHDLASHVGPEPSGNISFSSGCSQSGPARNKVNLIPQVPTVGQDSLVVTKATNKLCILQEHVLKMHKAIHQSGKPNFLGCKFPVVSNLNIPYLEAEASDYHDKGVIDLLKFGFPSNFSGNFTGSHKVSNHRGATDFPDSISTYLCHEKAKGAVIGPFSENPFTCPHRVNPLNTCPKRDTDERRVIVDLSFPPGDSVNLGIPKDTYLGDPAKFSLPTVDTIVEMIKVKGRGCALFKRDLRRAYRQLPVDWGDIHLLGYQWQGELYFDLVLPMGLRSSALCCQRTTNLISYICHKQGISVSNYLDDFIGVELWPMAVAAYRALGKIIENSGLEESSPKAIPPSFIMPCLGVLFDTMSLTLTITPERLLEISQLLVSWENKVEANKHELQSLVGKLMFVASCVRPGRVFVARLLNFLRNMSDNSYTPLPMEALADIRWWKKFMPTYNGVSMMPWQEWSKPDDVLSSDACPSGCGAWVEDEFFHRPFPAHVLAQNLDINSLELLTVVVAVKLWGNRWQGKRIMIYCDNMTSVVVINSGASRHPFLQNCLREICFWAAVGEFEIRAAHIEGTANRVADALSRYHLGDKYARQFTQLSQDWHARDLWVPDQLFTFSHTW